MQGDELRAEQVRQPVAVARTGRTARLLSRAAITVVIWEPPPGTRPTRGPAPVVSCQLDGDRRIRVDDHPFRLDADDDTAAAEAQPQLKRLPFPGQPRIDPQDIAAGTHAGESERKRLPQPAHRGEMHSACARPGQVVEIDPGGHLKASTASVSRPARAKSAAWIAGESELP